MISKLIHLAARSQHGSANVSGMEGETASWPGGCWRGGRHHLFLRQCDLRSAYPGCCIPTYVLTRTITVSMNHGDDVSKKQTELLLGLYAFQHRKSNQRDINHNLNENRFCWNTRWPNQYKKNKIYFSLFPDKTFLFHASIALVTMVTLFIPTSSHFDICWLFTKINILFSFSFPPSSFSHVLFENMGEVRIPILFWGWRGRRAGQRVGLGFLFVFFPVPASSIFFSHSEATNHCLHSTAHFSISSSQQVSLSEHACFLFTLLVTVLLPSIFPPASQSCFSLSDGAQNERSIGLHFQDASWRLKRVSCSATQTVRL